MKETRGATPAISFGDGDDLDIEAYEYDNQGDDAIKVDEEEEAGLEREEEGGEEEKRVPVSVVNDIYTHVSIANLAWVSKRLCILNIGYIYIYDHLSGLQISYLKSFSRSMENLGLW